MKNLYLTIIFSFLFIGNVFCQNEKERNWSVEVGGVYNQWHQIYRLNVTDTILFGSWTKFHFMPSLRINRQFKIAESIYLKPFIGVSVNGTQTDISFIPPFEPTDSFVIPTNISPEVDYAYYYMPQIELGTFADFALRKSNLQLGIKAQYHLTLWTNHTYQVLPEILTLATIGDIEHRKYTLDNLFRRFNMDLGIRYQYNFKHYLVGIEGWYGIRDITHSNPSTIERIVHTTNLRLMFGYKF